MESHYFHSNTTLVKVKFKQLQRQTPLLHYSNTTLVKVKSMQDVEDKLNALEFKYNSC